LRTDISRGPVTAAQAVSRRHGGRDHQHFAERFGAHESNQPARTIKHANFIKPRSERLKLRSSIPRNGARNLPAPSNWISES